MAQHKSERPTTAAANRGGSKSGHASPAGGVLLAGAPRAKAVANREPATSAETIEARLDRKAAIADGQRPATKSLGQMSREQRHKLLYGD